MNKRKPDTEIFRDDKRSAAIHEAGHVVVAAIEGNCFGAYIIETETDDPINKKTWIGSTGGIRRGKQSSPAVGVAGAVAETLQDCDFHDPDPPFLEDLLCEIQGDPNALSDTDRGLVGDDETQLWSAIVRAADILAHNEAFFQWVVNELIRDGTITDGMTADYVKRHELWYPDSPADDRETR